KGSISRPCSRNQPFSSAISRPAWPLVEGLSAPTRTVAATGGTEVAVAAAASVAGTVGAAAGPAAPAVGAARPAAGEPAGAHAARTSGAASARVRSPCRRRSNGTSIPDPPPAPWPRVLRARRGVLAELAEDLHRPPGVAGVHNLLQWQRLG